jgi:tRNA-specific 2-thiouridylase
MNKKKLSVLIGLTGRLDSMVAAALLQKQGYHVIGLTLVNLQNKNYFLSSQSDKNSALQTGLGKKDKAISEEPILPKCFMQNVDLIKSQCDRLNIPLYVTDISDEFEDKVIDRFVANRLNARANSSCFYCMEVRLQTLYSKMKLLNADFFSLGLYAKVIKNMQSGEHFIHVNQDSRSDQSFLLSQISDELIPHLLLPLGDLRKEDVQAMAKNFHLSPEPSSDQEHFCFRKHSSLTNLLKQKVPPSLIRGGEVLEMPKRSFVGDHEGMLFHYFGEKNPQLSRQIKINPELEIVHYDVQSAEIHMGTQENLSGKGCSLVRVKMKDTVDQNLPLKVFVRFKYSCQLFSGTLFFKTFGAGLLEFEQPVYPLIPHETIAFYDSALKGAKIIGVARLAQRGLFSFESRVRPYRENELGDLKPIDLDNLGTENEPSDSVFRF